MPATQMDGHHFTMPLLRYEFTLPAYYIVSEQLDPQGYLDIVKWLCEKGGAAEVASSENGRPVTGINRKSVGGWTPLSQFELHHFMALI